MASSKNSTIRTIPLLLNEFVRESTFVVRSPGRINLIGEFTDYNSGFVLPAAIDKAVYVAVTPRSDETIQLFSCDFNENYITSITTLEKAKNSTWPNYILGVADEFKKAGVDLKGFDAVLSGDVPIGSGLSSSAAVECAVATALNEIHKTDIDNLNLVKMSQRAENEFVGVKCGIMDQFASVFGMENHAMKLDCRSLEYEYIPVKMDDYSVVLLNSNVKHSHGTSEYNTRRSQCEYGVEMISRYNPSVKSLRDATHTMLQQYIFPYDLTIYRRCKYILDENERVLSASEDLKSGDLFSFGKRMFASHEGIKTEFEASCPELDFLVDSVKNNKNVLGARMMGGGFGGCTINIVLEKFVEELVHHLSELYRFSMKKELTAHVAKIDKGTTILKHGANIN